MAAGYSVVPKKKTVIWLATDENASNPFEHVIGDDCDCPICEDRGKRTIIVTQ